MGRGTLREVRDGSEYTRGGPERIRGPRIDPVQVGGPSGWSGAGWGTIGEVRDNSVDPWGGPGRVGGPLARSETGRWTFGAVRDGLWDPQ